MDVRSTIIVAIQVVLLGCNSIGEGPLVKAEEALGTDDDLSRVFHSSVVLPELITLDFPGFIVGIEKAPRKTTGAEMPAPVDIQRLNDWASQREGECCEDRLGIEELLDDGKPTLVTHIMECAGGGPAKPLYSFYEDWFRGRVPDGSRAWCDGERALEGLRGELLRLLDDQHPTHVILISFGWNDDQATSIHRMNLVVHGVKKQAGDHFRPVVIGTTWPSLWRDKGSSVANKADDADEVGLLWANRLIHDVIGPAIESSKTKVPFVAIGHSYGARILSRAMVSRPLLHAGDWKTPVDLLIAVQGAFGIQRFGTGEEGDPYARFRDIGARIVLSCSDRDPWNKMAFWSYYAGSMGAFEYATRQEFDGIFLRAGLRDGRILGIDPPRVGEQIPLEDWGGSVLYIDATEAIGSHSGMFNELWNTAVWKLIEATRP